MVNKIVVAALVIIVSCPILLGYAMNFDEVASTGYRTTGESVNVTPLLQEGTAYNYAHADLYVANTNFTIGGIANKMLLPIYNGTTSAKTSLKGEIAIQSGTSIITSGSDSTHYQYLSYYATYIPSQGYITMNYTKSGGVTGSLANFHSFNWDAKTGIALASYYTSDNTVAEILIDNWVSITSFTKTGSYNGTMYVVYDNTGANKYIDVSKGYHFVEQRTDDNYYPASIYLPTDAKSAIMSINLDSITASSYSVIIDGVKLEKTTTAGVVNWTATLMRDSTTYDLYYDSSISDNTYQFYEEVEYEMPHKTHFELRYVGHWPTVMGEANYYQMYSFDSPDRLYFQNISLSHYSSRTPTIRIDDATFRAFEYPIINDATYVPASFKTNPITTISNPIIYGSSLTFGGSTFTVTDGSISLDGRSIPVKDLQLSSVLNDGGTYDNKIGNTIISTTANPSSITFNGKWSASISTTAQESYTYTKTEWTPGQFGWDGLDHNFLMVGLLTSIGVFIALGLYVRRTKSSLWPLLVVCGGAVMLFFVML